MGMNLSGKRIAFIATDGFEQVELTRPWEELRGAGAETELLSLKAETIQGMHHLEQGDAFPVDKTLAEADIADYDGLVLPGGLANPDTLRMDEGAVSWVRRFVDSGKPVAAICHAAWLLVEADRVLDRTLTSWHSLRTDITNAGGHWVDEAVHVDNGLVSSRNPGDLDAFCGKAIETFAEGAHGN